MKQGWEIRKLDNIIDSNVIGLTKNSSEQNIHHEFKYVKMNNITKGNCFDLSKYTCVNAEKSEIEKYRLSNDDFLFNTRNSYELVGKTCLFKSLDNEVILYNNNIMRIRFLKLINPYFINYAFSTDDVINKLDRIKSGTTNVSAIYYKDLRNLEIPLPPLPEQKRIVAILDEAFAAIAQAKANAEQNLKNAKELFESYLQSVFENKGEDWNIQQFEDCFKLKSGDGLTSKMMGKDGTYPVFGGNGVAGLHNEFNLSGSNVIIGRVGALCGNVRHITENIWLTDNAFKVVNFKFNFDHSFLTYLLNYKNLRVFARQAAQPVISNSSLKDVVLEFPKSLKEQQIIVQKLDALSAETKQLETIYQQKINDLDQLKKSILQKAFAGELNTTALVV